MGHPFELLTPIGRLSAKSIEVIQVQHTPDEIAGPHARAPTFVGYLDETTDLYASQPPRSSLTNAS